MNNAQAWFDLHYNEFVSDLSAIISIPSVSVYGTENREEPFGKACADVLEKTGAIARRFGFQFLNDGNWYGLLTWEGERQEAVAIYSHLDVVPAGPGWSFPPYALSEKDGVLAGRGVSDNKGPALCVLYVLRYLKEQGYRPRHTILQFFGVNEECGMRDVERFKASHPAPALGLVPDATFPAAFGEKGVLEFGAVYHLARDSRLLSWSSGTVSNAVPGLAEAELSIPYDELSGKLSDSRVQARRSVNGTKVTAKGVSAHSARPEKGESAEVLLAKALLGTELMNMTDSGLLESLLSLFSDCNGKGLSIAFEDEESGKLTHVGSVARLEDGLFHQTVNIRYPVRMDGGDLASPIADSLIARGFQLEWMEDSPPMYIDKSLPVLARLAGIANEELGMDLEPYVMTGGTYARHLENTFCFGATVPGDNERFGPGRGQAHQADESKSVDGFRKLFQIYARALPEADSLAD